MNEQSLRFSPLLLKIEPINTPFACRHSITRVESRKSRVGQRATDGAGAVATALVWTMGVIWIVNSYFQGMGVGPCVKTLPQWFPPEVLSTKQSIWNLSHSIGAGAVFALCGWVLIPLFHAWRLCFLVPALERVSRFRGRV